MPAEFRNEGRTVTVNDTRWLMSLLAGETVSKRKKCLASLVAKHLISLGHEASVVENRKNSAGHIDRVVVESSIGLIHLTASSSREANAAIPAADFKDGDQSFLADKTYVAYGWNSKDQRTVIMFVEAAKIWGKKSLTKNEIRQLSERHLNKVISYEEP